MKKVIVGFDKLFTEFDLAKAELPEDMTIYVLLDGEPMVPISLIPVLQNCKASLNFINNGLVANKYVLIGMLCADANNEVYVVEDEPTEVSIMNTVAFTSVKAFSQVLNTPKKAKTLKLKAGVQKKDVAEVEPEVEPEVKAEPKPVPKPVVDKKEIAKKIEPMPKTESKKTLNIKRSTVSEKKKNDTKIISIDTGLGSSVSEVTKSVSDKPTTKANPKVDELLTELKKIDKDYPFEEIINPLATAIYSSTGTVSLEIQIRINCGKDRVDKLYPMLIPHFNRLKKIVN